MGFDAHWLDLREPADLRARDASLLTRAVELAGGGAVLDLGCGTGATARAFAAAGAAGCDWRFLDNDPALLSHAGARHPQAALLCGDLAEVGGLPLKGVRMVAASALLDLVSEAWLARLAERLARHGTGFYAALSYDGVMRWQPEDPRDARIRARFNTHQRGDKGFGPALGPEAAPRAAAMLRAQGFEVQLAPSPWRLGPQETQLQTALLDGIAGAAQEIGCADAAGWRMARHDMLAQGRAEIGHLDLLALPPAARG
ncbi:hypothetical protein RA2_00794 [Roseovarius sp. A-2]|nr:hypothetical protein RA2_00794 [Roseovarius sp. A-2]